MLLTMNEYFKSLKEDFERAYALWILNNMDLVSGYAAERLDDMSMIKHS